MSIVMFSTWMLFGILRCGGPSVVRQSLCMIFVLSGCNCKLVLRASVLRSAIMLRSCGSEVATNRTSPAKRRFDNMLDVVWCGCSGSPHRLWFHLCLALRITLSDTQLKSRELNGSPCLVPLWITKHLLRRSVLTAAASTTAQRESLAR